MNDYREHLMDRMADGDQSVISELCDEIERLRTTDTDVEITQNYVDGEPTARVMRVVYRGPNMQSWVRISTEVLAAIIDEHNKLSNQRDAWRTCADQLAAGGRDAGATGVGSWWAALATYERLKAGPS